MGVGLGALRRLARRTWLVSIAAALGGAPLGAQTTRPDSFRAATDTAAREVGQRPVCFRDRPRAHCLVTVGYAVGTYRPFVISKVEYDTPNFGGLRTVREETLEGPYFAASLDMLWNRDERHALGVGAEAGETRRAFRVVYRRWLDGAVAVDVAPGVLRTDVATPRVISFPGGSFVAIDRVPRTGGTLGVDLHYRHWAIASARADYLPGGPTRGAGGYVGAKVDGYWALAATAIAGLLYGALAAAYAGS